MTPGPDRVIACPHCGFLARQHTLISGNTFGAIFWSDGKREAPMLPEFPAVAKCHGCKRFYWVNEAKVKGEIELFGDKSQGVPEEWERAKPIEHLTIDEYIEALDTGVGSDVEKQRYLRVYFFGVSTNSSDRLESGVASYPHTLDCERCSATMRPS